MNQFVVVKLFDPGCKKKKKKKRKEITAAARPVL
jgi:hypothetical protein